MSAIRSAISSSAASQEIRSHSPDPRGPTRRIGCSRRLGLWVHSGSPRMPFTQKAPCESGLSGFGMILVTRPASFTVINDPQ